MANDSKHDKRRFYRHPIRVPIEYAAQDSDKADRTDARDLSEGGVCFLSNRSFNRGQRMQLKIPAGDRLFQMDGEIAYCRPVIDSPWFRVGVAFCDAEHAFRLKLAEQLVEIKAYREQISLDCGHSISEEEAAQQWIEKYAKRFSELF